MKVREDKQRGGGAEVNSGYKRLQAGATKNSFVAGPCIRAKGLFQ